MTDRKRDLLRAIVRELKRADGDVREVVVIQVKVEPFVTPEPTLKEIQDTLRTAEEMGFIHGVTTETDVQVWAITHKGRLAQL